MGFGYSTTFIVKEGTSVINLEITSFLFINQTINRESTSAFNMFCFI